MTIAQIVHDNEMFFGLSELQIRGKVPTSPPYPFLPSDILPSPPKANAHMERNGRMHPHRRVHLRNDAPRATKVTKEGTWALQAAYEGVSFSLQRNDTELIPFGQVLSGRRGRPSPRSRIRLAARPSAQRPRLRTARRPGARGDPRGTRRAGDARHRVARPSCPADGPAEDGDPCDGLFELLCDCGQ
jgi:hypothetical protein